MLATRSNKSAELNEPDETDSLLTFSTQDLQQDEPVITATAPTATSSTQKITAAITDTSQRKRDLLEQKFTELSIADVITQSKLKTLNDAIKEFNKNVVESCFTTTSNPLRGRRLNNGQMWLATRNKIPELIAGTQQKFDTVYTMNPNTIIENIGTYHQSDIFFGTQGSYYLKVPSGQYAKAFKGNEKEPVLFGPGVHVIHDPNFEFRPESGLINQNETYIQHGLLHIIRVPPGKVAAVTIGSTPGFLESRDEPYIIKDANFQLHGSPSGEKFYDATAQLIVHGSLKRLFTRNEFAVTYDGSILKIIKPSADNKPTILTSPNHLIKGFLPTVLQTESYPSQVTIAKREKENPRSNPEERIYEMCNTRDGLEIGVKITVGYTIVDPEKAVNTLGINGISAHIEAVAASDMQKAIKACSFTDFLTTYQTKPQKPISVSDKSDLLSAPSAPPMLHVQDVVRQQLANDLNEFGIELTRLNIAEFKIMNPQVLKEMEEQSVIAAKANAQEAVIEQNAKINSAQAQQAAYNQEIEARAKYNIAKMEADATKLKAEAQRQADITIAEGAKQAEILKAEGLARAAELKGEIFTKHPELYQLAVAETAANALRNATVFVAPQDVHSMLAAQSLFANSPIGLFNMQQHRTTNVESKPALVTLDSSQNVQQAAKPLAPGRSQ